MELNTLAKVKVGDQASREDLLHLLEVSTGRSLRTREDVSAFKKEYESLQRRSLAVKASHWKTAKQATLLFVLASVFVQYYLVDRLVEVSYLSSVTFTVPLNKNPAQS